MINWRNPGNLPSIPLDELPGTIEFARKTFGDTDIWKHAEGEYRKHFSADDLAALAREVAGLRRGYLKLVERVTLLERRR